MAKKCEKATLELHQFEFGPVIGNTQDNDSEDEDVDEDTVIRKYRVVLKMTPMPVFEVMDLETMTSIQTIPTLEAFGSFFHKNRTNTTDKIK